MILLENKKARHEYEILKSHTVGIVLTGAEVKSLRSKKGSLTGSFAKVVGGEVYLLNAQINPYDFADNREYDPKRTRKLLLKKKEIAQIVSQQDQKNYTLVPLKVFLANNKIKVELGVGKGLKKYQKKEKLKERDLKRASARELGRRY